MTSGIFVLWRTLMELDSRRKKKSPPKLTRYSQILCTVNYNCGNPARKFFVENSHGRILFSLKMYFCRKFFRLKGILVLRHSDSDNSSRSASFSEEQWLFCEEETGKRNGNRTGAFPAKLGTRCRPCHPKSSCSAYFGIKFVALI